MKSSQRSLSNQHLWKEMLFWLRYLLKPLYGSTLNSRSLSVMAFFSNVIIAVKGGYSEWGDWAKCSVTCGNGSRVRRRECNNPAPEYGGANCSSLGLSEEVEACNETPCSSMFLLSFSFDEVCSM